ncbi:MAG: DUF11 domain-containing protein [Pirellulales bacterium]
MRTQAPHHSLLPTPRKTVSVLTLCVLCIALSGCRNFYGNLRPIAAIQPIPPGPVVGPVIVVPAAPIFVPTAPPVAPPAAVPSGVVTIAPPVAAPVVPPHFRKHQAVPPVGTLQLTPRSIIAPVGSEVVLLTTTGNGLGQPVSGQRIEWMLSPNSVGQFITIDQTSVSRKRHGTPQKVDNNYAVGTTSKRASTLTRGTPTQMDDVTVQPGQSWISVSSATDGVSYVTSLAPNMPAWDGRKQTAIIYWVDAQFSFPAPTIGPVGSRQVLSSVVTRSSDGSPIEGYHVRYSVTGGSPAGLGSNGAAVFEVPTDADGRGIVEITQLQPARGENTVQVEVVRPASLAGAGNRRLIIGRGATMVTWASPDISVQINGPQQAQVGSTATYRVDVVNTGHGDVTDLVLTNRLPAGLRYQQSSLPAESNGGTLQWQIGQLAPGQTESFEVDYEVTQRSTIRNCITAKSAEGLIAESCATTDVLAPSLRLDVTGPATAVVGESATFAISISNPGDSAITGLLLRDTLGEGLVHDTATSPITRQLGTLGPGESRDDLGVALRVTRAGRVCHTVELVGDGIPLTQRTVCIDGVSSASGAPPPVQNPPPVAQANLQVEKLGPPTARVGDTLTIELLLTNAGDSDLTNIIVTDDYDIGLKPLRVSEGFEYVDEKLTWKIDRLAPSESQKIQVEVSCEQAARACSRATVSADGGVLIADEVCIEITPAGPPTDNVDRSPAPLDAKPDPTAAIETPGAAALKLNITDLRDEVAIGQTIAYEVTITNLRNVPDHNVELFLDFPAGMTPVPTGTEGPSQPTIAGRRVRFNPVAELRAEETLIFRIAVRADRAGRFIAESQVISAAQQQALQSTEETNIYSEGGDGRINR